MRMGEHSTTSIEHPMGRKGKNGTYGTKGQRSVRRTRLTFSYFLSYLVWRNRARGTLGRFFDNLNT